MRSDGEGQGVAPNPLIAHTRWHAHASAQPARAAAGLLVPRLPRSAVSVAVALVGAVIMCAARGGPPARPAARPAAPPAPETSTRDGPPLAACSSASAEQGMAQGVSGVRGSKPGSAARCLSGVLPEAGSLCHCSPCQLKVSAGAQAAQPAPPLRARAVQVSPGPVSASCLLGACAHPIASIIGTAHSAVGCSDGLPAHDSPERICWGQGKHLSAA